MATPTCPLQLRLYKLVRRAMVIVKCYFKAGMGQRVQWNIVYISDVLAPASGRKPGQARPKIAKPSRA